MIYILAQGKGSRWKDGLRVGKEFDAPSEYKQLIPINGKPNLFRTIDMLNRDDYMVVASPEMFEGIWLNKVQHKLHTLSSPGSILDGISQLTGTVYLLGDVVFSKDLLNQILSHKEDKYTLWGRKGKNRFTGKAAGEIFALTASVEFMPLVRQQLNHVKLFENKLWGFYNHRMFCGYFMDVFSWTDDIDSPEEYEQFYNKLNSLATLEDEEG